MHDPKSIIGQLKDQLSSPGDFRTNHLHSKPWDVHLIYLSSVCDPAQLHQKIMLPYEKCDSAESFLKTISGEGGSLLTDKANLAMMLVQGNVMIVVEMAIYALELKKKENNDPMDVQTENTITGPQKALSEDIWTNVGLLRMRYLKPSLAVKSFRIGSDSNTEVVMLYDSTLAKRSVVQQVEAKLRNVKISTLHAAGQLQLLLNDKRRSLFPIMMISERPDRLSTNLAQGKVVLLVDGTPFALAAPAVFYDFFSAMDDIYQSYWISRALIVLRYIALLVTIGLPAVYIAVVSFNPDIFRAQLASSIAGSRAAVPYPSYLEVMLMLFMIEALMEASVRLPKLIGSTATTVGGLILGQAAQQAGLVSSIMIIVTSAVAIANFVIPINSMSYAIRFVKYILILLASIYGTVGVVAGFFLILGYLASLRSFGEPYLRLAFGESRVNLNNRKGRGT